MARSVLAKPRKGAPRKTAASFRTYRSALGYLNSRSDFEKVTRVARPETYFNLSRMQRLLAALGNPQRQFRSVHVAGTKGKGSTAVMLAEMLSAAGHKVGLYTSPHMLEVRERVRVGGRMISEPKMTRMLSTVARAVGKLKRDEPTFFETITAVAFLHFAAEEVDVAIIEVGLGGRLDSTNVIRPEVCAVTSISRDHESVLGSNLADIAVEKAGIFKSGIPVVSAPQTPEVENVLRQAAEKVGAPISVTGKEIEFSFRFEASRETGRHTRVCVITPTSRFEHLHVPLLGDHQAVNCGLALGVLAALRERGFEIEDQKAIDGLAKVRLPGRMEIVSEAPRILVDGAHNAASIRALMHAIGQNVPYDSMVVIFGAQADKDIPGMLKYVQLGADKVIFTPIRSPRSADPHELCSAYTELSGKMAQVADSLTEALEIAERAVTREDLICICGSFYLVGQSKRLLARRET